MKILIALDTDGVFFNKREPNLSGPIDPNKLYEWVEQMNEKIKDPGYVYCVVVSESPYYPVDKKGEPLFAVMNDSYNREGNLLKARSWVTEEFGPPDLLLYVSDNGWDKPDAKKAGFIYVSEQTFATMVNIEVDEQGEEDEL